MKRKINVDIDKILCKIPRFIVLLLIIFVAPLGVWIFVIQTRKNKMKIYSKSRTLIGAGLFILFLIGIGLYSKIKEIVELSSSGMSLDMINFMPDNLWFYLIGIVMCVSYFIGAKKLTNQIKNEKKYIKLINFNKISSLKKIGKKLSKNMEEVKEDICALQSGGYLIPFEIDEEKDKIIYIHKKEKKELTGGKHKKSSECKKVQCPKCGAIVSLKLEEYVECDFCGYGLFEESNS